MAENIEHTVGGQNHDVFQNEYLMFFDPINWAPSSIKIAKIFFHSVLTILITSEFNLESLRTVQGVYQKAIQTRDSEK